MTGARGSTQVFPAVTKYSWPGFAADVKGLIKVGGAAAVVGANAVTGSKAEVRVAVDEDVIGWSGTWTRMDSSGFTIVNVNEICEILKLLGGDYTVVLRDKIQLTLSRRYPAALDDFLARGLASLPKSG